MISAASATDGNRDHGASLLFQCFEILHCEDVVGRGQQCGKPGVSGELCHGEASGRWVGFTLLQIGLQQGLPYCGFFAENLRSLLQMREISGFTSKA